MKFNKEEYKEQVKDQVWNKFKWSLISVSIKFLEQKNTE